MNKVQRKRLSNVAKALRESPDPDRFSMDWYGHQCGSPMCALGHYAFRRDLQRTFRLSKTGGLQTNNRKSVESWIEGGIYKHFGINASQGTSLFESDGCGGAETNIKAAEYIERFIEKRDRHN